MVVGYFRVENLRSFLAAILFVPTFDPVVLEC